ncbi:MAG: alkaline phosphatase family protein [Myxococcota bacterium]
MRVMILGLDCVPPSVVFDRWAADLPHLNGLRQRGMWGPLRSTRPPITVPAWACMASGADPGELGLYGFRNRTADRSYALRVANARDVRVKRLWDRLSDAGHRVASLFVPLTSPPTPVRGQMVSCFLHADGPQSFPPRFLAGLEARFGAYMADIPDFRTDDLERVFGDLHRMRDQHFAMAQAVWQEQRPDFLMMVEMGPDRLHHAAWHHMDRLHPRYEAGNPWESRCHAYYVQLDARVGDMLDAAGDDTLVMVVSDHGARAMERAIAVNDVLRELDLLALAEAASEGASDGAAPLRDRVDWSRTTAWAEGGYYARLFLNVCGREPEGTVSIGSRQETLARVIEHLKEALAVRGVSLEADLPERTYRATLGEPPDAMLYFDDLRARALGTVGHADWIVPTNDHGPDGCNHDWNGIFIAAGPGVAAGKVEDLSILDVAPTVLDAFGVEHSLHGRSRFRRSLG